MTPEGLALAARVLFIIIATLGLAYMTRPVVLPLLLAGIASMTLKAATGSSQDI